jgi:hypothetical protein
VAVPFLLDAGLSAAIGPLIAVRADRWAAWAGAVLEAGALGAYAMARTVGLLGFVERGWTRPSVVAAGCEAVVVVMLVSEVLVPPKES